MSIRYFVKPICGQAMDCDSIANFLRRHLDTCIIIGRPVFKRQGDDLLSRLIAQRRHAGEVSLVVQKAIEA